MKYKIQKNNAFTIIELLVAVGILVVVLSFSSVIFKASIESHRIAMANAEIMQKLRAITGQLDADFRGLRKDGEICIMWVATPRIGTDPADPESYDRFDRVMFFADGDFQSYGTDPMIRGNIARICYMLARRNGIRAQDQDKTRRVLARTQHILINDDDPMLEEFILDTGTFGGTEQEWYRWNNVLEYDKITLDGWKTIRWDRDAGDPRQLNQPCKKNILSVITDIIIESDVDSSLLMGSTVEPTEPNLIHQLLCEGVGEFKIQGWSENLQRWVPEVDPNGVRKLNDTDFFLDPVDPSRLDQINIPGVVYPFREILLTLPDEYDQYGLVKLGGTFSGKSYQDVLNENSFNSIPGLGKALKFTFTLYDLKGVIKEGRTFTHIVYLDD